MYLLLLLLQYYCCCYYLDFFFVVITYAREVMLLVSFVCLSVCLSRIMQKLPAKFAWNFGRKLQQWAKEAHTAFWRGSESRGGSTNLISLSEKVCALRVPFYFLEFSALQSFSTEICWQIFFGLSAGSWWHHKGHYRSWPICSFIWTRLQRNCNCLCAAFV